MKIEWLKDTYQKAVAGHFRDEVTPLFCTAAGRFCADAEDYQNLMEDLALELSENSERALERDVFRVKIAALKNMPRKMIDLYRAYPAIVSSGKFYPELITGKATPEEQEQLLSGPKNKFLYFSLTRDNVRKFLRHCPDRRARQQIYAKYMELCWRDTKDPYCNVAAAHALLKARQRYAETQGYENYTAWNFTAKGEKSLPKIKGFLQASAAVINPMVKKNLKLLGKFAQANLNISALKPWDIEYVMSEMAGPYFNYTPAEYEAYFEAKHTITGVLDFFSQFFALKFTPQPPPTDEAKQTVFGYTVTDKKSGDLLGAIELCLFDKEHSRAL